MSPIHHMKLRILPMLHIYRIVFYSEKSPLFHFGNVVIYIEHLTNQRLNEPYELSNGLCKENQ